MSWNVCSTWEASYRRVVYLLPAAAMVLLVGCGGEVNPLSGVKLYPVKGKVTLPDGKPLAAGKIVFVGAKSTSNAKIEPDGSFTVKGTPDDGLPEGEYNIRLETEGSSGGKKGVPPFPIKYLDESGSGLTATVKPDDSGNNFDFQLTASNPTKSTKPRGGK